MAYTYIFMLQSLNCLLIDESITSLRGERMLKLLNRPIKSIYIKTNRSYDEYAY